MAIAISQLVRARRAGCWRSWRCALTSLALAACAQAPVVPPLAVWGGIPADGLNKMPRIVADPHPIELSGFEMTPSEWAGFENHRSRTIRENAADGAKKVALNNAVGFLPLCLIPPLCPLAVAAVGVGAGAGAALGAAGAASWFIPPQHGSRLASIFNASATGTALQERVLRLSGAESASDASGYPLLVVRVRSARLDSYPGERFAISVTAEAQVFPAGGMEWEPTGHEYQLPQRSLSEWIENDDALIRQGLEKALEELAKSIVSEYRLEPLARTENGGTPLLRVAR